MLALAAAINFCSLACFIGSAPAIIEKHWGMSETSYAALFLPVITGIMLGAVISRRIAGRMDLTRQVHMGLSITFTAALLRVLLHVVLDPMPSCCSRRAAVRGAIGAQFAFRCYAANARPVSSSSTRHSCLGAIIRGVAGDRLHARHRLSESAAAYGVDRVDVADAYPPRIGVGISRGVGMNRRRRGT